MKSVLVKTFRLLSATKRRAAILLLGLIIVGTLFEVMGVGLLLPVIALLMNENLAVSYPALTPVLSLLGNPTHDELIKIVLGLLVAVYLGKNVYLAFLVWWQARFTVGLQIEFSQRLFTLYLRQPYHFHLQRNSAQLIRNITGEVGQYIGRAVTPMLRLTAESMVLIGIVILLLAVEPVGSIIVFAVLLTAAWLFYRSTRIRVTRWGQIRQYHDGQRIQHLQQGLGGVKDVKLLGRETDFLTTFNEHNSKSGQVAQFMEVLQKLPRLWMEILAVSGFVLLVLIMLSKGRPMSEIMPVVGLFAASAFRLMPSVNRILVAVQALRFGMAAVDNLYEDLSLEMRVSVLSDEKDRHGPTMERSLELKNISFCYPSASSAALRDISIAIAKGDSVGFIGPSGSGKSTLVDIVLGLLDPDGGQVLVDDTDVHQRLRQWQNQIGYVPQEIYLTDDSLRRNIAFGLPEDQIDDKAVERAVRAAQIEDFVATLPDKLETRVGERGVRLSGGQRQRIGIARSLYHDPGVLVLDEATSALDTETERGVMDAVTELQGTKTIIIVAHRLSTVENCDYLYKLDHGEIVGRGSPEELLRVGAR